MFLVQLCRRLYEFAASTSAFAGRSIGHAYRLESQGCRVVLVAKVLLQVLLGRSQPWAQQLTVVLICVSLR